MLTRHGSIPNLWFTFAQRDILSHQPTHEQFDIIVSNPPYIKEHEKEQMEAKIRKKVLKDLEKERQNKK